VTEPGLERHHLARDLRDVREDEALAQGAERPLDRRDGPDARLPTRAIGVTALHLQRLFAFHPA
jgi:hypothetical protein